MKTKLLLLSLLIVFCTKAVFSQLDITYNLQNHSGFEISCHGGTGVVDATPVNGVPPYTFAWTGPNSYTATTEDISGIPAGTYRCMVTDSVGDTISKSVTLNEPKELDATLNPSDYNGYNISVHGKSDGKIDIDAGGGATPYFYLWNDNSTGSALKDVPAGTYSVQIKDNNMCTINKNITLTEPAVLSITSITASTYGSNNVKCYRGKDGSIILTVTGGVTSATAPYKYEWSNGSFKQNPDGLGAGKYYVRVTDVNDAVKTDSITLTEPSEFSVKLIPSSMIGYNVSCNGCTDGTITTTVIGGTSAFTYLWEGSQTTANRSGLSVGDYNVTVTDANGCKAENGIRLNEPAQGGWTLNSNIGDTTNSIGTINNAPLIFKTNNLEQLRIAATGEATFQKNLQFGVGGKLNYRAATGGYPEMYSLGAVPDPNVIDKYKFCTTNPLLINAAYQYSGLFQSFGMSGSNLNVLTMGFDGANGVMELAGTTSSGDPKLYINTNCGKDVIICGGGAGKVGIGNVSPTEKLQVTGNAIVSGKVFIGMTGCTGCSANPLYKLYVDGGIMTHDVKVTATSPFPDYVFEKEYKLMTLAELEKYIAKNKHLPELPSAKEIEKNEGYELGDMQTKLVQKVEEQTLYIISLQKQMDELKKQLDELKHN
jgi:SprB repeat